MLDIKFIRENIDLVKQNCQNRHINVDFDRLLAVDQDRRERLKNIENRRALRKQTSKGKPSEEDIAKMRGVGEEIKQLENQLTEIETEYSRLLLKIPNLTHPDTPVGGEKDFRVVYTNKKPTKFTFTPKDHEKIMTTLDLIDFARGAKVAAAKFYYFKGDMVRLNQALLNYGIDVVTKHGYTLMETPDMAKNDILRGIGFNPRGEETQVYSIENTNLSLIGTAEITVGGYHADEILDLKSGPKKYVALSHCFRTEAGTYGHESKGLYRV